MMLYPAISTVSTWFSERRALALGLTSTVSSRCEKTLLAIAHMLIAAIGWVVGRHCLPCDVPKLGANDWLWMDNASVCYAHLWLRGRFLVLRCLIFSKTKVY